MEFDLEYKLQLFREEQPELFNAKGKRYTGTALSNRTAEIMFELINELESALIESETGEVKLTIPVVSKPNVPACTDCGDFGYIYDESGIIGSTCQCHY